MGGYYADNLVRVVMVTREANPVLQKQVEPIILTRKVVK